MTHEAWQIGRIAKDKRRKELSVKFNRRSFEKTSAENRNPWYGMRIMIMRVSSLTKYRKV